jgi:hypothetical protein
MRILMLLALSAFAFGQVNDFGPQSPVFAPVVDIPSCPASS